MIDIFNRKKIKELENELKLTNLRIDQVFKELRSMERVNKYAKDTPTFRLIPSLDKGDFPLRLISHRRYYDLYLYIDGVEYIINLDEGFDDYISSIDCKLDIDGDIAIFTIEDRINQALYKYVISYKDGKYIRSVDDLVKGDQNNE